VKTALIIILVLAAVIVAGGSYYYFEVYEPEKYANGILSLYQNLESAGLQPDTSLLKDATDYASALQVLQERINLLKTTQNELPQIKVPKRMVNFQKEFSSYLDFTLSQHESAETLGTFLKNASELNKAVKEVYGSRIQEKGIATIGDLQKFWGERIPKVKTASEEFVRKEIQGTEPSFSELKSLWEEAAPAFAFVLQKVNKVNPRLQISQAGNIWTQAEQKQLNAYTKKLDEFATKIEDLLKKYTAYDLLAFRYFPDVSEQESSERALKFYQSIQKLKEQYGR